MQTGGKLRETVRHWIKQGTTLRDLVSDAWDENLAQGYNLDKDTVLEMIEQEVRLNRAN